MVKVPRKCLQLTGHGLKVQHGIFYSSHFGTHLNDMYQSGALRSRCWDGWDGVSSARGLLGGYTVQRERERSRSGAGGALDSDVVLTFVAAQQRTPEQWLLVRGVLGWAEMGSPYYSSMSSHGWELPRPRLEQGLISNTGADSEGTTSGAYQLTKPLIAERRVLSWRETWAAHLLGITHATINRKLIPNHSNE